MRNIEAIMHGDIFHRGHAVTLHLINQPNQRFSNGSTLDTRPPPPSASVGAHTYTHWLEVGVEVRWRGQTCALLSMEDAGRSFVNWNLTSTPHANLRMALWCVRVCVCVSTLI